MWRKACQPWARWKKPSSDSSTTDQAALRPMSSASFHCDEADAYAASHAFRPAHSAVASAATASAAACARLRHTLSCNTHSTAKASAAAP
ncbi:hypothetical protein [Pseudoduganella sp. UC29_71]|uniref:hypothetical protein n=1 Tax=Pseudoduganella sp. UC29_71 TaxID=3350174 RepID=UPI00366BF082